MKKLLTILGPTASGKTDLAAHVAYELGGEIISGDSRQVYRGMDIGTGKDLDDYVVNGRQIPYHLIDICEAGTKYNLFQYQEDFLQAYKDIERRDVQPILCGGTGLYIESVLKGYHLSPVPQNQHLRDSLSGQTGSNMHNSTDVDSCQRAIRAIEIFFFNVAATTENRTFPAIDSVIVGVSIDREARRAKITERLKKRLDNGMVEEIKGILNTGVKPEDLIYYGLEYKYVTEYVIGQLSYEEMFRQLEIAIHQFAKRQMTWFRGMERRGATIHWIDALQPMETKVQETISLLQS